ncbi:MAG: methyltransferase domain-containing protein [Actinomycetota bacterium]|nr:methyltransferase domain-containing protein [Actinomycetota bacterium]
MDRQKIEAFLDRFIELASGATTIGLLAVADRSGLSEYLESVQGGTSAEIAVGAGLDQRYVEEILSGLAAAGVVDYDPESERFDLPPEHALFLSDEESPYFMGGWFDMIPAVMGQLDGVANATINSGGVAFEKFGPGLIRGIGRGNGPSQRIFLTNRWLPAVPGLADRLQSGIRVADVGCGTGSAAILIAQAFPNCQVFGFDNSEASIDVAAQRSRAIPNATFLAAGVENIPVDPKFDLVTSFDVIHDLAEPQDGMRRIREALADDGLYLMMEPNASSNLEDNLHPRGALLYGISTLHCMTQSLAIGGEGLGAAWGRQKAERYANDAGFTNFEVLEDISNRFSAFYLLSA